MLESQLAKADEQTISLMQENVSHLHAWKMETERKDRIVVELRRQVAIP